MDIQNNLNSKISPVIILLTILSLQFLIFPGQMDALDNSGGKKIYVIGVVPQFGALRTNNIWVPIIQELEKKTGLRFELKGSPTIPDFEQEFLLGVFDFVYMNPYHILPAHQFQGYSPLVRDTGTSLYGVLVVLKDSPIKEIKDLDGSKIAFPAPNALGASLMIRLALKEKFKINFHPVYVKTHSSVYLNVIFKEVAAGGGVQKTLENQIDEIRENLRIIYKTPSVSPHPFAAHPRVPASVRELVQSKLLEMGNSDEGRKMLSLVPIKKIGTATMKDYQSLQKMGLEKYYRK